MNKIKESENINKRNGKMWLTPERALFFGFILILICPYLITRKAFWISFDDTTGVVGDTIGGITAPITGLVGAYLVYKALQAQIQANKLISDQFLYQHKKENILQRVNFVREDFDHFLIFEPEFLTAPDEPSAKDHTSYEGIEAIMRTFKIQSEQQMANAVFDPVQAMRMETINRLLMNLHSLIIEVYDEDLPSNEKAHIFELIQNIFYTRVSPVFNNLIATIPDQTSMWYTMIQKMAWSNFKEVARNLNDLSAE